MATKKEIYGITGLKGHGKDTFANYVVKSNPEFKILHFADPLKNMCKQVFGLSDYQVFDPVGKESCLPDFVLMDRYLPKMKQVTGLDNLPFLNLKAGSPREIMQLFGTNYVRAASPTYWLDCMSKELSKYSKVLIPDCRFLNEAEVIRQSKGKIIRILRSDLPMPKDMHLSEQEQLNIQADVTLAMLSNDFRLSIECGQLLSKGRFSSLKCYDYERVHQIKQMLASNQDAQSCIKFLEDDGTRPTSKTLALIMSYYKIT